MAKSGKGTNSFEDQWSATVAKKGVSGIPVLLMRNQAELGITMGEMTTLIQLLSYRYGNKLPFPSARTLGKHMSRSERTARRLYTGLKAKGLIRVHHRNGRTNQFDVTPLIDRLKMLASKSGSKFISDRTKPASNVPSPQPNSSDEVDSPNVNLRKEEGWTRGSSSKPTDTSHSSMRGGDPNRLGTLLRRYQHPKSSPEAGPRPEDSADEINQTPPNLGGIDLDDTKV